MPVRIRLSRHGKKDKAFFHLVVADGRAPRDGKFIEKIGTYNPHTNPVTLDVDFEKAVKWLQNGAQPSDTCHTLLSHKGVMYKHHLLGGVRKGAFNLEQADAKFNKWLAEKEAKINSKLNSLSSSKNDAARKLQEAETARKEARAAKVAAKKAAAEAAPVAEAAAPAAEGEASAEAPQA